MILRVRINFSFKMRNLTHLKISRGWAEGGIKKTHLTPLKQCLSKSIKVKNNKRILYDFTKIKLNLNTNMRKEREKKKNQFIVSVFVVNL